MLAELCSTAQRLEGVICELGLVEVGFEGMSAAALCELCELSCGLRRDDVYMMRGYTGLTLNRVILISERTNEYPLRVS